jgi:hypothetical protein
MEHLKRLIPPQWADEPVAAVAFATDVSTSRLPPLPTPVFLQNPPPGVGGATPLPTPAVATNASFSHLYRPRVEPPPSPLLCPICGLTLLAPVLTPCGHAFCLPCIHRALDARPSPRLAALELAAVTAHTLGTTCTPPVGRDTNGTVAPPARAKSRGRKREGPSFGGDAPMSSPPTTSAPERTGATAPAAANAQRVLQWTARPQRAEAQWSESDDDLYTHAAAVVAVGSGISTTVALPRAAQHPGFHMAHLITDPLAAAVARLRAAHAATAATGAVGPVPDDASGPQPSAPAQSIAGRLDGLDSTPQPHAPQSGSPGAGRRRQRAEEDCCPRCGAPTLRDGLVPLTPLRRFIQGLTRDIDAAAVALERRDG